MREDYITSFGEREQGMTIVAEKLEEEENDEWSITNDEWKIIINY